MRLWPFGPRRAKASTSGAGFGLLGLGSARSKVARDAQRLLALYGEMPWLRSVNGKVAFGVASTEWRMFPGDARDLKSVRRAATERSIEPLDRHPFLDVLRRGTPDLPGFELRRVASLHFDLAGEAFELFELNGVGEPTSVALLPPHWVKETPPPFAVDVPPFVVSFPMKPEVRIPSNAVLWTKDANPVDPYGRGRGIAAALAAEIDVDEGAAEHARSFFENGARSDFVFIAPGVTVEERDVFLEKWNQKHQGWRRWWQPGFLTRDVKIEKLTQDFKDLGMPDLRRMQRDIIVQTYGVPPEILGIIESSNRATIEAADLLFAKWVLVPRLEIWRATYQTAVDRYYGVGRFAIDYVSPVTEDREFIKSVVAAVPWAFRVDEIRALAGHPELEGGAGRAFVAPFNLVPSDVPAGGGTALLEGGDGATDDDAKALARALTSPRAKITAADVARIVASIDARVLVDKTRGPTRATVAALGERTMTELGLGLSFDLDDPRVISYLQTRSARNVSRANATTRAAIRATLAEGAAAGEAIPALATRVSNVFAAARGPRSVTIARTETVGAAGFAQVEAYRQAEINQKEWLSTRDDATRDSHVALDGQVVDVADDFESPVTGATGPWPGQMNDAGDNVNCRCTTLPVFSGDASIADTEEKRVNVWKAREATRLPFERAYARAVRAAFDEQERAALAALRSSAGTSPGGRKIEVVVERAVAAAIGPRGGS